MAEMTLVLSPQLEARLKEEARRNGSRYNTILTIANHP